MEYSSCSYGIPGHESFADMPLSDEVLDVPKRHPQQEEQPPVYSTFDSHSLRAQQSLRQEKQPSYFMPLRQLPATMQRQISAQNQVPDNWVQEKPKLKTELHLQQSKHNSFVSAQPPAFIRPNQLHVAMQGQVSSQNQRLVPRRSETQRERDNVRGMMHELAEKIKNKRIELGFSEERVSHELNKICDEYNRDRIFSAKHITYFETQNMTLEVMLELKPMLDVWIEYNSPPRPLDDIPKASLEALEKLFQQKSYPSRGEIYVLSSELNLDKRDVFNWFNNRNIIEHKNKRIARASNSENSLTNKARKTRRYIPATSLKVLEKSFQQNTMPSFEINNLSKELDMNKKTLRKWFVNHRYKEKKNKQIRNTTKRGNSCSEITRGRHNRNCMTSRERALQAINA